MAEEVLKDIISPNNKREVTPQVILDVVADHFGVSAADIVGGKRNSEIVTPRQIVMYLCREITDTSYKNIGILLGNRRQQDSGKTEKSGWKAEKQYRHHP